MNRQRKRLNRRRRVFALRKQQRKHMKKLTALAIVAAAVLTGCSTSRVTKTMPDGTKFSAFNSRFIWATEGFEATYNTNGTATIKIQKSNPDAQTAAAVTEAAVRAAKTP